MPAGTSVDVMVELAPTAEGSAIATLVVQTEAMGASRVALEGGAS